MTKDKAIYQWFTDFAKQHDMNVYLSTHTEDAQLPYLTYTYIVGRFNTKVPIEVNLWFRTSSEAYPNEVAELFGQYIKDNSNIIFDGGHVWVTMGDPFYQSLEDEAGKNVKRRYINIEFEYCAE